MINFLKIPAVVMMPLIMSALIAYPALGDNDKPLGKITVIPNPVPIGTIPKFKIHIQVKGIKTYIINIGKFEINPEDPKKYVTSTADEFCWKENIPVTVESLQPGTRFYCPELTKLRVGKYYVRIAESQTGKVMQSALQFFVVPTNMEKKRR